MNTQAKVALDKQKHPERYCSGPKCLWKVMQLDHEKQTYFLKENCPQGLCPGHQYLRVKP